MRALTRLVALAALALGLLLASTGVSSARNWSTPDARGDVLTVSGEEDEDVAVSSHRKAGDAWRTSISHTRTKVVVRVTMRAVPGGTWGLMTTIRTPRGSFDLMRMRTPDFSGLSLTRTNGSREIRCAGKRSRVEGTAIVLSVPRRCLGGPRWVRVNGAVMAFGEDGLHVDDILGRSLVGEDFRYSPRIRRG